jgi:hypothetical protein
MQFLADVSMNMALNDLARAAASLAETSLYVGLSHQFPTSIMGNAGELMFAGPASGAM